MLDNGNALLLSQQIMAGPEQIIETIATTASQ